jgi:hypothetical protein
MSCTQCEFELRARPVKTAMSAGRRFHLKPHVTAIVGHGEDVVVRHRIRLGCPDDAASRISEGLKNQSKARSTDDFPTPLRPIM